MSQFTSGKFAPAICDRCGDKVKRLDLKLEWTGLLVCNECYDPKDPLEFPTNFPLDPEAIENPRPPVEVEAGRGTISVPSVIGKSFAGFELECQLGEVTVTVA